MARLGRGRGSCARQSDGHSSWPSCRAFAACACAWTRLAALAAVSSGGFTTTVLIVDSGRLGAEKPLEARRGTGSCRFSVTATTTMSSAGQTIASLDACSWCWLHTWRVFLVCVEGFRLESQSMLMPFSIVRPVDAMMLCRVLNGESKRGRSLHRSRMEFVPSKECYGHLY